MIQNPLRILDINIQYGVEIPENVAKTMGSQNLPSNAEMTENYMTNAVMTVYNKIGLNGQLRRVWGRIQTKVSEAVKSKKYEVELEDKEVDFLKNTFEKSTCPPEVSRYYVLLEDLINSM